MSRDYLKEVQRSLMIIKNYRLIHQEEEATTPKEISEVKVVGEIPEVALEETFKAKIKERLIKINKKTPIEEGVSVTGKEERKRLLTEKELNALIVIGLDISP